MNAPIAGKDVTKLVAGFYRGIGLDAGPILARSDLYEHGGKNPHAFCTDIDRASPPLNIGPNQEWLGTMPHELGHGGTTMWTACSPFRARTTTRLTEGARCSSAPATARSPGWAC
jgi:hypothetical protein